MIAFIVISSIFVYGVIGTLVGSWVWVYWLGEDDANSPAEFFAALFWPPLIPSIVGLALWKYLTREKPELPTEVIPIKPVKLGVFR